MPFNPKDVIQKPPPPNPSSSGSEAAKTPQKQRIDPATGWPVVDKDIPVPAVNTKSQIDRSAFYLSLEIGHSFYCPTKAMAEHCLSWGRKHARAFTKRHDGAGYRVWRVAPDSLKKRAGAPAAAEPTT